MVNLVLSCLDALIRKCKYNHAYTHNNLTGENAQRRSQLPIRMKNTNHSPIFLGGAGRSGTTLLRVMLDSHSHIACGPEFKFIPSIARHWGNTVTSGTNVLQTYGLTIPDVNKAYRQFILQLLSKYKAASGKPRLAEKSPNNVFFFRHLAHIFPQSPLVHVIRDGRDVVSSLLTMDWIDPVTKNKLPYVESATAAAEYWVQAVMTGRNAALENPVKENYYEIKYESLVINTTDSLRGLFSFIGEPWEPEVLEYHKKKRELAHESSAKKVTKPIDKSSIGRWETDLNEQDKDAVKCIAGKLLTDLGYTSDDSW